MPRFVVLEHDFPERHWDFMLETAGVLRTWRLEAPPRAGSTVRATASFDHRLMYLDYEGPVSGNRGQVRAWDRGMYEEEPGSTAECMVVCLQGQLLQGTVVLERVTPEQWMWKMAG